MIDINLDIITSFLDSGRQGVRAGDLVVLSDLSVALFLPHPSYLQSRLLFYTCSILLLYGRGFQDLEPASSGVRSSQELFEEKLTQRRGGSGNCYLSLSLHQCTALRYSAPISQI